MPNILALLHSDGTTAVSREIRNGIEQYSVNLDLVYNETGGEGQKELVIRNLASNNTALDVLVSTSTPPVNAQTGNTLSAQWDFKPLGKDVWNNIWRDSILIKEIPPGQFARVRTRVLASSNAEPAQHRGGILIKYLRSSV